MNTDNSPQNDWPGEPDLKDLTPEARAFVVRVLELGKRLREREEEWEAKLLTTEDVAKKLQVDPETVRRYVRLGKLKSIKIGVRKGVKIDRRVVRITSLDLAEFMRGGR